jgi:hypothetical protein
LAQTGINEIKTADELICLTRALIYAGASSVIVSLWSVYDPSTKDLMFEFYKLLKNGKDKATALQQAQINILQKEEYLHPYYWAPFILVGDWEKIKTILDNPYSYRKIPPPSPLHPPYYISCSNWSKIGGGISV